MKKAYPINKFLTEIQHQKPRNLLIFSVGNPSPKYDSTRHNAGHLALDYFIKNMGGLADDGMYWDSSVELAPLKEHPNILMAKSQEYMNNSGKAFKAAVQKLKQDYRIIVLHDDIDIAPGVVKFKLESRQMGAHGGLTSINKFYPQGFARLRIGIGDPGSRVQGQVASYVLKKFPLQEKELLMNKSIPDAFSMFSEIVKAMDKKGKASR